MNFRPALFGAAALTVAVAICVALYRWGPGPNRDLAGLARAVRHGDDLGAHLEAARRRHEAKRALAAGVVCGRMTLGEAAGQFRRLDEAHPGSPGYVAGPARDERFYYGQVLEFGCTVLSEDGRYAAAARWCAESFAAHPHVIAGPPFGHRYDAACAAVLAGCGQGRDAAGLDEAARAGFRRQALDWLRAELEVRRRPLVQALANEMQHWLWEARFDRVREPDGLARLPAAERQAWQRLWADVADTRDGAKAKAVPER
jgi:hypothetical protein